MCFYSNNKWEIQSETIFFRGDIYKRKGEKEKHKRQDDESYVEGRKRQMTKSQ